MLTKIYKLISTLIFFSPVTFAGNLEPFDAPIDYSGYTIEDICNRLDNGTSGTQSTFQEPTAAPGSTGCTLNNVMDKAPAKDDTNGALPSDVVSGKTYWGLTGEHWGLKTGTAPPALVPQTGESGSTGVAWPNPRFTKNNNGTVTDNLTGLIWLENANCTDIPKNNLGDAKIAVANLANGTCGLTDNSSAGDWRIPNVNELQSLVHYGVSSPAMPNTVGTGQWTEGDPFSNVQSAEYWTITTYPNSMFVWLVNIEYGYTTTISYSTKYVWPMRDGQ